MLRRLLLAGPPGVDPIASSIKAKLVSWWPLDSSMADAHGGNPFVSGATPAYVAAKKGNGNNASKRYTSGVAGLPSFHSSGCTIFFWAYLTEGSTRSIASLGRNMSAGEILVLYCIDGKLSAVYRDTNGAVSSGAGISVSLNTWAFVAISWRPQSATEKVHIWVSGQDQAADKTIGSAFSPQFVEMGSVYGTSWPLGAVIDEMGMTSQPLTQAELEWLFNSGTGRSYSEL